MLKVNYYFRKKRPTKSQSIELVFENIISALQGEVAYDITYSRFDTKGLVKRILNLVEAVFKQKGGINHVTGDENYLTLLLNKKKTVLTIHDLNMLYYPRIQGRKWLLFFYRWFWYSQPIKRATVVTVVSEATKTELLEQVKCSSDKINVIYNPINPVFRPCPKPFNASEPVILQVGTAYYKNIGRLALALSGIACRLEIIGQPQPEDVAMLEKHGITYHWQSNLTNEEVYQKYVACDLVAFASLWEGFGLPIVEAQTVGRPVVTSNLHAMPEIAGQGACLVDPYRTESIREGILRTIEDSAYRANLVAYGHENSQRFCNRVIAESYLNLYKKLS